MRTISLIALSFAFMAGFSSGGYGAEEEAKGHGDAAPKMKVTTHSGEKKVFDLKSEKESQDFLSELKSGHLHEVEIHSDPNPLEFRPELAIWTIVVFVVLMLVLRKLAWAPMLEGLQKREQSIRGAVDEAKLAREETQRIRTEFQAKMDEAFAQIPKMMEEARREATTLKEEMRTQTTKEIALERTRLRGEIDMARDQALQELWSQTAQLATLISAKALGREVSMDDHRRLVDETITQLNDERGTKGLVRQ